VNERSRQIKVVSTESTFWEGFHLAPGAPPQAPLVTPKPTKLSRQTAAKRNGSTSTGSGNAKEKPRIDRTIDKFFSSSDPATAKRMQESTVPMLPTAAGGGAVGGPFARYEYHDENDQSAAGRSSSSPQPPPVRPTWPPPVPPRDAFASYAANFQPPPLGSAYAPYPSSSSSATAQYHSRPPPRFVQMGMNASSLTSDDELYAAAEAFDRAASIQGNNSNQLRSAPAQTSSRSRPPMLATSLSLAEPFSYQPPPTGPVGPAARSGFVPSSSSSSSKPNIANEGRQGGTAASRFEDVFFL